VRFFQTFRVRPAHCQKSSRGNDGPKPGTSVANQTENMGDTFSVIGPNRYIGDKSDRPQSPASLSRRLNPSGAGHLESVVS